jgi:nicotinate-nucleotide adenylyltransferase
MTGLFFGSFNPIHLGHTALANYLLEHTALDEIWMVVSPHNPLKKELDLLDDELRLHMVQLALSDEPKLKACDVEFSLSKPNYTLYTLQHLSETYPDKQFVLIIGADNLAVFHQWKAYQELLNNYHIMVYPRQGVDLNPLHQLYPQVEIVDAPLFTVSSTQIRRLLAQKETVEKYLHPLVKSFIQEKNLYSD